MSSDSDEKVDSSSENENSVDFKPVVELQEVKTSTKEYGEVLLKQNAKLYRYDMDVKEWKERGKGIIKIIGEKIENKFMIFMEQEGTGKKCAHHLITSAMNLEVKENASNALKWTTKADYSDCSVYSENKPKPEILCMRLKDAEQMEEFQKVFRECQDNLKKDESETKKESIEQESTDNVKNEDTKVHTDITSSENDVNKDPESTKE